MKAKESHKLNAEEVTVELRRLHRKVFDLRTQAVTEKIADVSQFKKIRKDIARLNTERRARERAATREGS
jgi:large subunit ribosomal protein L29